MGLGMPMLWVLSSVGGAFTFFPMTVLQGQRSLIPGFLWRKIKPPTNWRLQRANAQARARTHPDPHWHPPCPASTVNSSAGLKCLAPSGDWLSFSELWIWAKGKDSLSNGCVKDTLTGKLYYFAGFLCLHYKILVSWSALVWQQISK